MSATQSKRLESRERNLRRALEKGICERGLPLDVGTVRCFADGRSVANLEVLLEGSSADDATMTELAEAWLTLIERALVASRVGAER